MKNTEIYSTIRRRYLITPVLSIPIMTHRAYLNKGIDSHLGRGIHLSVTHGAYSTHITMRFPPESAAYSRYTQLTKSTAVTLESLLSTNDALRHLVGALWSIYRSNNIRLSQSFLSLIRLASERRTISGVSTLRLSVLAMSGVVQLQKLRRQLFYEELTRKHIVTGLTQETRRRFVALRDRLPMRTLMSVVRVADTLGVVMRLTRGLLVSASAGARGAEGIGPTGLRGASGYGVPGARLLFKTERERVSDIRRTRTLLSESTRAEQSVIRLLSRAEMYRDILSRVLLVDMRSVPVMQRVFEEIEANSMFYTAASYQSARTLHRLINSLWKVYNNQNLELSRSFTQLINTVTEKNTEMKITKSQTEMFSSTRSLTSLVSALRRAFSGNNLQLRHSMVSLTRDMLEASGTTANTSGGAGIRNTRVVNYHIYAPHLNNSRVTMRHRRPAVSRTERERDALGDIERAIEAKLRNLSGPAPATREADKDELYKYFTQRMKRQQREDSRLERIVRGMV